MLPSFILDQRESLRFQFPEGTIILSRFFLFLLISLSYESEPFDD